MMKKLTALILAAMLLMLTFAGSISAAANNKQSIQVWINDQKVQFDVPPILVKGTTYVEFKGLFKALGYSISYDEYSKVITGKSEQGTLTLNTLTGAATVNGKKQEQSAQPIIQQGRTLVPLRFIAEATNLNVKWNKESLTITITSKGSSEGEIKELQAFLNLLDEYSDTYDIDNIRKLLYPGSPLESIIDQVLDTVSDDNVVTKTTSTLTRVLNLQGDSAVIEVEQLSNKVSGGFYLDNKAIYQLQLKRGEDQQWKLYMLVPEEIEYLNVEEAVSKEADVPADEKAAILDVIDKQIQATNAEDLEAYKATLDPSMTGINETIALTKQVFAAYDLKVTLEVSRIVEYSDTKAVVYVVQKTEKLAGPAFEDNRTQLILTLIKSASGQWLNSEGTIIKTEAI
ncbi:copper amine oxidase N-terminal domain-containing protein [Paenibacillus xylaniclasticus]|uniref:copper amine oxidase N-terminal domain-containing protein n=1 Tax=Paenibacillus xylaniclasticus TaxID=588083 RepID=UPI000FDB44A7|nr:MULTISPECIES: copper amine oxidase N-terminal domain-containing protein [Paenibacillus]